MKGAFLEDLQLEISPSDIDPNPELLQRLIRQIFYISPSLPPPHVWSESNRKWLCSLFLLHGIDLNTISIPLGRNFKSS